MAQSEKEFIKSAIDGIDKSIDLVERLEDQRTMKKELFEILEHLISAANTLEMLLRI